MKQILSLAIHLLLVLNVPAEEVFCDYFDIAWGSPAGTEVMGKLNLRKNKDAHIKPIPSTFQFVLKEDADGLFTVHAERDARGRLFGVLRVAEGNTMPAQDRDYPLVVALCDGSEELGSSDIVIHLREQTLWSQLRENFLPLTTEISRMYGRFQYTDQELEQTVDELIENNGRFSFSRMYGTHPGDYDSIRESSSMTTRERERARSRGIEGDWQNVVHHIGGLGYAYAHSETFGLPSNNPEQRQRLKKAIYLSAYAFMSNVGVYGDDVMIDGSPSGPFIGDGFATLNQHRLASHGLLTHQWEMTDALASPLAQIMPELLADRANGNLLASRLYGAIKDYFQIFFAEVPQRRAMDDEHGRWEEIQDEKRSNGAWADANIEHRLRTLMLLPIVFADYNQPITYVPYWYDDFFNGTAFEGKTFSADFSPRGVIQDLEDLSRLFSVKSYKYGQSGFHPDGTVSHHTDHGSDTALYAYGYHWLTSPLTMARFWDGCAKPVEIGKLQFIADRFNHVYSKIIYKNRLDFTVIGRSYLADTYKFVTTEFVHDGEALLGLVPEGAILQGKDELEQLVAGIRDNSHTCDASTAFWNADYVLHRKESERASYYFSVKNKSVRTVGAEDFTEIRKSWHFGSGVFQLKVAGDEYSQIRLNKWDHHVVPGVTEEWRVDPLPTGKAYASGPGLNVFSGQLADGMQAMAAYHHMPGDDYTSANALKSWFMQENIGTALGTDVSRVRPGQGRHIVTTIDQVYFDSPITIGTGTETAILSPEDSHDLAITPASPFWIHQGEKGYLVFPREYQAVFVKTNDQVNVTNPKEKTRIKHYTGHYELPEPEHGTAVMAIDHGTDPNAETGGTYHYAMVANVQAADMPKVLDDYLMENEIVVVPNQHHAVSNSEKKLIQVSFFAPGTVRFEGGQWINVNHPALVMLKRDSHSVILSVSDPLHSVEIPELVIETDLCLKSGRYYYDLEGVYPRRGEFFLVEAIENGSRITVKLPDLTDTERYQYQELMYAGSPLITQIPLR